MRCREARLRLIDSRRGGAAGQDDRELLDHLKKCPNCTREAEAAQKLQQLLAAAGADDLSDLLPLTEQKRLVEARTASPGGRSRSALSIRRATIGWPRWRPALGLGVTIAVSLLAILTLVPFRYHRTVGYEVAFAGVNRELVEEDDRICDMLYTLGLPEAAVDVRDCDTTCRLTIIDLKSKEEVQLVVSALARANTGELTTDIVPIRASASGSLLDQANERILR